MRDLALVGVPALLATGLCLIQIDARSLGFDEAATAAIVGEHGAALRSAIAHDGGNMSGYYVLMHAVVVLFGNGKLALRLPSAIGAGTGVALTVMLALRLLDRRAALASGLLMAVSLPLIFWGQSARSYTILVALSAASFLAFVVLLEPGSRPAAWVAYVICTALALYASLMAALIVPVQLIVVLRRREKARAFVAAIAGIAVCCVPLIILGLRRGTGQLFWVTRPSFIIDKQVAQALTSAGLEPTFRPTTTTYALLVVTLLALAVIGVAIAARDRELGPGLVLAWAMVPVVLAAIESIAGQSIFVARNLLTVLPAVALLLGWGLTRAGAGFVLVAVLVVLRALQLGPAYGVSPEDWRAATGYVLSRARAGDCVAFYPADGRNAFRYYVSGHAPRSVLPAVPWSYERAYIEKYATLTGVPRGCSRLWLISSHAGRPRGPAASRANRARYLRLRAMLQSAYRISHTRRFGYADAVTVEQFGTGRGA